MIEKQTPRLRTIFRMATIPLPPRISSIVSKLKAENVLKPPQNPVITKKRSQGWAIILSESKPIVKARIRQLKKLEMKVANGKTVNDILRTTSDIPNRARLPNPPPIKTTNSFVIVCMVIKMNA
jgi:hypothetical protein